MKVGKMTRQLHRWVSIVFTLAVTANVVAMGAGQQEVTWVTYTPLPPLLLLLLSGLYLFVLPYVGRRRGRPPTPPA